MAEFTISPEAEKRFWEKVDRSGECWEWTGALQTYGYGLFGVNSQVRAARAHRVSYQMAFGPIPKGLVVCHRCDNRKCVRPDHLFLGTNRDNTWDAIRKGRIPSVQTHKPDFLDSIKQDYESGLTLQDIATKNGVTAWTIRYHLERMGVPRRPRTAKRKAHAREVKLSFSDRSEILTRYHSGERIADLSRRFGVDPATIRYHIKQAGKHQSSA